MIGIVMLFGLVAKNGILLVDYSNTLCKRGMRVRDAVLQAASTRFRPILMTTCAMIFGMLPLSLGFAEGGEWRQAMGTVIIGGLLSSLILTLFLVPMIYNTWMGFSSAGRIGARSARTAEVREPVAASAITPLRRGSSARGIRRRMRTLAALSSAGAAAAFARGRCPRITSSSTGSTMNFDQPPVEQSGRVSSRCAESSSTGRASSTTTARSTRPGRTTSR